MRGQGVRSQPGPRVGAKDAPVDRRSRKTCAEIGRIG